ncbi:MAG TPA: hydantoinase/carbamoylase family amidase [Solirubrobacteraceae bacterium]|nr:hydantoinase/carbamoylase family amidase [Solirubrobacteraceae bacterium]
MADRVRIQERLAALWGIAQGPAGGADRPAFSPAEAQAIRLVAGWATEAGLRTGLDGAGNLWALPPGDTGALVTAGSHVDTVPDGGRYDGALGTVLGLELAAELPGSGLMVCVAEEAPRFGAGTIGSRLLTGALAAEDLERFRDDAGVSAAAAREQYLAALADLDQIEPPLARWRGHAEVHVAQRWALKRIGVVTRVASPRRYEAVVSGAAGHSGELSMDDRRDALAAAAELVLAVEAAARAEPAETVATVGTLTVSPGAVSIVPGSVRLGIDVRAIEASSLDRVSAALATAAAQIGLRRCTPIALSLVRDGSPVQMDAELVAAALQTAVQLGVPAEATWSGAGHDAQHLSALTRALLLFVPLHDGESHTPAEGASLDESLDALRVAGGVLRGVLAS